MKFFFILSLLLSFNIMAQDRVGTGGTGSEMAIINEVYKLEDVAEKIIQFFARTSRVRAYFPEFDIEILTSLRGRVDYEVVSHELRDDEGTIRSCLNYDINPRKKIVCNLNELQSLSEKPEEYFTLVAHELFGLAGLEESSIHHQNLIQSYPISGRIARYVSRVSSYDLVYTREGEQTQNCNLKLYSYETRYRLDTDSDFYVNMLRALREKGYNVTDDDDAPLAMILDNDIRRYTCFRSGFGEVSNLRTNWIWSLGSNELLTDADGHQGINRRLAYRAATGSGSYQNICPTARLVFITRRARARINQRRFNEAFQNLVSEIPTCSQVLNNR